MAEETFVRLQWLQVSPRTGQPQGVFAAVSIVERSGILTETETRRLAEIRDWFEENVPNPPFYENGNPEGAVTWFKSTAQQCLTLAREMADIVRAHGVEVHEVSHGAPGRVIYEDAFQVAVLPQPEVR
ncbi:MAG: hypothetical protein FJW90_12590 [Actinobacteria bacterium]|nr:hypothetical protein [Actinomycetota bacterium]MBM4244127.1 hypothetical protein [Deltaproteobacteria bacterium]